VELKFNTDVRCLTHNALQIVP